MAISHNLLGLWNQTLYKKRTDLLNKTGNIKCGLYMKIAKTNQIIK